MYIIEIGFETFKQQVYRKDDTVSNTIVYIKT